MVTVFFSHTLYIKKKKSSNNIKGLSVTPPSKSVLIVICHIFVASRSPPMSSHHARLLTRVGQIDAQLRANNKIYEAKIQRI